MGTNQEDLLRRIRERRTLQRIQERRAAVQTSAPEPAAAPDSAVAVAEPEEDPSVLERVGRGARGVARVPGAIYRALTAEDEEPDPAQPFRAEDELSLAERALLDIGEGVQEIPSALGRGLSEVGHRTAIGVSELVGADKTAANLRASRELSREAYGEPETITGRVAEGATQLVGEGALFMAPGAAASRGAQALQATGRSSRFLSFLASPRGFAQRAAQTFLTGAPIDAAIAAAGPEESLAAAIGAMTGDEELTELAQDPVSRGTFEVLSGFGLGTALGEGMEAVGRARARGRAGREAAEEGAEELLEEAAPAPRAEEPPPAPREEPAPEPEPEPPPTRSDEDADLEDRLPQEVLDETRTPEFNRRRGARRRASEIIDPEGARVRADLEDKVVEQARATRRAFIDEKTGLANQNAFERARARAEADPDVEIVSIDVRNQKAMNDLSGSFALADDFLRQVADQLRGLGEIPNRDIFRSGGDEFAFFAPAGQGEELARRVQEAIGEAPILDSPFTTGVRYGVGQTVEEAEQAVQAAKKLETGERYRDVTAEGEEATAGGAPELDEELERLARFAADSETPGLGDPSDAAVASARINRLPEDQKAAVRARIKELQKLGVEGRAQLPEPGAAQEAPAGQVSRETPDAAGRIEPGTRARVIRSSEDPDFDFIMEGQEVEVLSVDDIEGTAEIRVKTPTAEGPDFEEIFEVPQDVLGPLGAASRELDAYELPRVGEELEGAPRSSFDVGEDIPNTSSIAASLTNYEEVGIRSVPIDLLSRDGPAEMFAAADDVARARALAEEIRANNRMDPLIVVQDGEGYYVLEGVHRLAAANELGEDAVPALVIRDLDELEPGPSRQPPPDLETRVRRRREVREEGGDAATPWHERELEPATVGDRQRTLFPGDGRKVETEYAVMEASDVRASHTADFTQRSPDEFPPEIQGRAYHGDRGRAAREYTEQQVSSFDPDRAFDRTVSSADGPPTVTAQGINVAGNGRTITLQRLYQVNPERADRVIRGELIQRAEDFGLDADVIAGMDQPILVRRIVDDSIDQLDTNTLRELNQSSDVPTGKAKDALSDAFSRSEQLRAADGALRHFAETIPEDATLRGYLETAPGAEFLRRLVEDGVINQSERARFLDVTTGTATSEGKDLVERMMYSAAIGDADVLARAPSSVLGKMDTALPAIIRADRVEEFAIGPTIRAALDLLASARAQNMKLGDLVAQVDLTRPAPDPNVVRMARFLQDAPKNSRGDVVGVKDAFRAYADEAEAFARQTETEDLFGFEPRGPEEAAERFGELAALTPDERTTWRAGRESELEDLETRLDEEDLEGYELEEVEFRIRELEAELMAADGDVSGAARGWFGTTEDPELAGYVLEDGDMLDFSGGSGMRAEDHRAVSILYPDWYEPPNYSPGSAGAYMADFINRGNVRLSVHGNGSTVVIDVPPRGVSKAQLRRLFRIAKDAEDVFVIHSQRQWADEGEVMLSRPGADELNEAILSVLPPAREAEEAFDALVGKPKAKGGRTQLPLQRPLGPASTSHPLTHDLFGEPIEEAVGQGDLLAGRQGLQGIQEAMNDARATVSRLEGLAARGAASADELRRLQEARTLLRSQAGRGLDAGEVAARATGEARPDDNMELFPLAPTEGAGSRLPQSGGFRNDPALADVQLVPAPEVIRNLGDALSDAMEELGIGLGLKTATGKMPRGGMFARALGVFNSRTQVVRQINLSDVPVFGHEAGHAMHKVFFGTTKRGALTEEAFANFPGAVRGELEELGKGISDGSLSEGWAEFWRRYLDNPEILKLRYPNTLELVEGRLAEFPAIKEAWMLARQDWTAFRTSSAQARVGSAISVGDRDPFVLDLPNRWTRFRTAVIDDMEPVRRITEKIREAVGIDSIAEEADTMARLTRGSVGVAQHFLDAGTLDFKTLRKNGPALRTVLEPVLEDLDAFRRYMVARRADELQRRNILTGIRPADVQITLRELEAADNGAAFKAAFDGVQKWNRSLLGYLRDAGVISKDSFEAILELNQSYVPFYRVVDGEAAGAGLGGNFGHLFSPVKRIKGSGRTIVDPIESLVKNAMTYTQIAQKQQVSQALARLARKEGVGPVLEKLGNPIKRSSFKLGEIEGQLEDALPGAKELLEDLRAQAEEDFKVATEGLDEDEIEALGITQYDPAEELLAVFRPGDYFNAPNTISVLEDGRRVWYEVDEELHAALTGLDRESLESWARWVGIPARTLRAGATLAPEFLIRNPIRDQVMAFVQSEYGYIPFVDMAKGAFELVRKGEAYDQWRAGGGYRAALTSLDRRTMQNNVRELVSAGGVRNVIKHPFDALQVMSALMEDATRVGEFLNARAVEGTSKAGLQRAAAASREVSIDFARHGAKTAALRHIAAFWNARLQGYDRLARAARKNPAAFATKAFAAITLPSLLEYAANRDDPDYWEQPQWKRDLFWLIKVGDDFVALPKPFELGLIFGTLPVRILDSAIGGPGGNGELHDFLFDSLLKGESSGFIPQPTALMPLIENVVNYSFFLRRPIVPDSEEEVRARYQAGPYTSEVARLIGRWSPGEDGISPRKIDNLLFAYTGGLGRLGTEIADPFLEGRIPFTEGPVPKVGRRFTEFPGIRGVMDPPAGFGSESVSTFYELYERARVAQSTYNYLERADDQEGLERETSNDEANRLRSELPALRRVANRLAELRADVESIRRDPTMSSEEKRVAVEELGLQARQEAAAAIPNRNFPEG